MKRATLHRLLSAIAVLASLALASPSFAAPRKSLLDNDPEVVYINEHLDRTIHLMVAQPAAAYSSKNGGRKLGTFPANTKVELLAIGGENAYRVKGKTKNSTVSGWVSPKLLASKDKNFIANLKQLYKRQMTVKELIENQDVAIGMTLDEVKLSLGEPTKTEVKQTRKGSSGKWEYIITEEEKHYQTIRDPRTGRTYRQVTHITTEERERTTLEFEDDVVTSVTRKRDNGPGKVRIIPVPIVWGW
ncbi:hypothetical protein HW115_17715 [Verrucomicrobiaceae bacterium N1E253]|uniref:SH3b domain-containing protein n=1 Tax=Oceaniferula marina TaxID=2748318 RepID=A0A851GJX6_9BACT|nr:hypothetical protein [Oceaniferula marina]NWK57459.1 hypothetical protein [Oceaniferula marina]